MPNPPDGGAAAAPFPGPGRSVLKAWLRRYVEASARPVNAERLALQARKLGWSYYAVQTLLSELYRERQIGQVAPGVYRSRTGHLRRV